MNFTETIRLLITANAQGANQSLNTLEAQAKKTDKAVEGIGKTSTKSNDLLKRGLVAGATALVGTGLVTFLNNSVKAYGNAAKAAGDLAKNTGSSVETVSRMTAALEDAGISAEQTAGLLTKFTTSLSTEKGQKALQDLNVELVKGKDGSTDYAETMVKAVDAIGDLGDASERNRQLVALFGKQGAKAFQDLYASGVDLGDAMKVISKYRVFTADDVQRAINYDDAMDGLNAAIQGLQFSLGKTLIPLVSTAAGALSEMIDVISAVPTEVYLAVGAFLALQKAWKLLVSTQIGAGLLTFGQTLWAGLTGYVGMYSIAIQNAGTATGTVAASLARLTKTDALARLTGQAKAAGVAMKSLAASFLPMLAVMAAITAVFEQMKMYEEIDSFVTSQDRANQSLEEQAVTLKTTDSVWHSIYSGWQDNAHYMTEIIDNTKEQANETLKSADATEAQKNAAQHYLDVIGNGTKEQQRQNAASAEGLEAQRQYIEQLGGMAYAVQVAADAQTELNNRAAEYVMSGGSQASLLTDIAKAARDANDATLEQKQSTELAEIAMGLYATSIQGVVEWQNRLAGNTVDAQTALGNLQDTLGKVGKIVNDPDTWENEVKLNTAQATQDLYDYVAALAASGLTDEQVIETLVTLKKKDSTGKEADALIQDVIDSVKGKENEIPVNLKGDVDKEGLKADVDTATSEAGAEAEIPVKFTAGDTSEIDAKKAEISAPIEVPVTYVVGGLDAVNQYNDDLAKRNIKVGVEYNVVATNVDNTENVIHGLADPSKYRIEYNTDVTNDDNTENVLKGLADPSKYRIEYNTVVTNEQNTRNVLDGLDRDRDVYVRVHYQRMNAVPPGVDEGRRSVAATTSAAPSVYQTINISVPGSGSPAVTAREIDRYLRKAGNPSLVSVS